MDFLCDFMCYALCIVTRALFIIAAIVVVYPRTAVWPLVPPSGADMSLNIQVPHITAEYKPNEVNICANIPTTFSAWSN